jgi:Cu(I)-responsive transcriptional regulator
MPARSFTIGQLASQTGAKAETIRYYERIGVMPEPARSSGNYRAYSEEHVRRLAFIRRCRDLGFTLEQVRELLRLSDQRDRPCDEVDAIARQHLAAVEGKIADLSRLADELRHLSNQCGGGSISECRVIEALGPPSVTA